jgi:hypothetical protein
MLDRSEYTIAYGYDNWRVIAHNDDRPCIEMEKLSSLWCELLMTFPSVFQGYTETAICEKSRDSSLTAIVTSLVIFIMSCAIAFKTDRIRRSLYRPGIAMALGFRAKIEDEIYYESKDKVRHQQENFGLLCNHIY